MAIKGWTDGDARLPRLGHIALGVKTENGTPVAVDYFVVPPEVQEVYGPQPRELDVVLPAEDVDVIMPAWLKRYGNQFGLICRSDGETAGINANYLKNNSAEYGVTFHNGKFIGQDGEVLNFVKSGGKDWVQNRCLYQGCPLYPKKCTEVAILSVILYKVPGVLGVYSLDTGSFNSYQNVKNSIQMLQAMVGRASFIPLKLKVRMQEVNPTISQGESVIQIKKKVPIIYLDMGEYTLENVIEMARERRLTITALALPAPKTVDVEPPNEEEKPDLIYPPEVDVPGPEDPGEPPPVNHQDIPTSTQNPSTSPTTATTEIATAQNPSILSGNPSGNSLSENPEPQKFKVLALKKKTSPKGTPIAEIVLQGEDVKVLPTIKVLESPEEELDLKDKTITADFAVNGKITILNSYQVVA